MKIYTSEFPYREYSFGLEFWNIFNVFTNLEGYDDIEKERMLSTNHEKCTEITASSSTLYNFSLKGKILSVDVDIHFILHVTIHVSFVSKSTIKTIINTKDNNKINITFQSSLV